MINISTSLYTLYKGIILSLHSWHYIIITLFLWEQEEQDLSVTILVNLWRCVSGCESCTSLKAPLVMVHMFSKSTQCMFPSSHHDPAGPNHSLDVIQQCDFNFKTSTPTKLLVQIEQISVRFVFFYFEVMMLK